MFLNDFIILNWKEIVQKPLKYYKINFFEDLRIWLIVSNPNKSQENKKGCEKKCWKI
jgi:hypothetical protein